MGRKRNKLEIINNPHPQASILDIQHIPAMKGQDNEESFCGECLTILLDGVSLDTVHRMFATPAQLLLKCFHCGKYNRIPAKVGH